MIQNLPGVGRVIPGQRTNMPKKLNHQRPFGERPNIAVAVDGGGNAYITLQYTLQNGQSRTAWYAMKDLLTAELTIDAIQRDARSSASGSGFAGPDFGGEAFNTLARSQPVVISTP